MSIVKLPVLHFKEDWFTHSFKTNRVVFLLLRVRFIDCDTGLSLSIYDFNCPYGKSWLSRFSVYKTDTAPLESKVKK